MIQSFTDHYLQMNRLSLGNNQFKFKIPGQLPIILEESLHKSEIVKEKPEDHNM